LVILISSLFPPRWPAADIKPEDQNTRHMAGDVLLWIVWLTIQPDLQGYPHSTSAQVHRRSSRYSRDCGSCQWRRLEYSDH